ncbi:MAG: arginine--tRNA ligase domain-containing protein, partial [Bacteroidia bacterium]
MITQNIQKSVSQGLQEIFGATVDPAIIQIQETRKEFTGDFTIVVFPLTRSSKKSPQDTADELGHYLEQNMAEVEKFEVVKGFLNLSLTHKFWTDYIYTLGEKYLPEWEKVQAPKHIMVEYSSPNTNKPLHLGHIRNNLLGYAMAEILKARGHKVTKANLINDRGIHICKSMLAWGRLGNGETPQSAGLKGDHLVGKYYVIFEKILKEQSAPIIAKIESGDLSGLNEKNLTKAKAILEQIEKAAKDEKKVKELKDEIKDIARNETEAMQEAQEMLRKWEA